MGYCVKHNKVYSGEECPECSGFPVNFSIEKDLLRQREEVLCLFCKWTGYKINPPYHIGPPLKCLECNGTGKRKI